jgi:hypothetical protein
MIFKSAIQPLCRSCGKPIRKHTETVYPRGDKVMGTAVPSTLYSKADCQALTNKQVVSVSYHQGYDFDDKPTGERWVWAFSTWDGESYVDRFFCGGPCRDRFAYACARIGKVLAPYNEAVAKRGRA